MLQRGKRGEKRKKALAVMSNRKEIINDNDVLPSSKSLKSQFFLYIYTLTFCSSWDTRDHRISYILTTTCIQRIHVVKKQKKKRNKEIPLGVSKIIGLISQRWAFRGTSPLFFLFYTLLNQLNFILSRDAQLAITALQTRRKMTIWPWYKQDFS